MPRRVLHDPFFKQAKAEGYLARSAYKLVQIQEAKAIIHKGDWVLDLGCAPGAWMQVAGEIVGPSGVVIGIDLQEVAHRFPPVPPMVALKGDIYQTAGTVLVGAAAGAAGASASGGAGRVAGRVAGRGGPGGGGASEVRRDRFDVVLSDMAPNTTGHGDHERSIALCERVLEILPEVLRRGGHCAIKVFEGGEYPRFLKSMGRMFEQAKGFKPEASRAVSREMYVVGTGYKGPGAGKSGVTRAGPGAQTKEAGGAGAARAVSDSLPRRVPGGVDSLTRSVEAPQAEGGRVPLDQGPR